MWFLTCDNRSGTECLFLWLHFQMTAELSAPSSGRENGSFRAKFSKCFIYTTPNVKCDNGVLCSVSSLLIKAWRRTGWPVGNPTRQLALEHAAGVSAFDLWCPLNVLWGTSANTHWPFWHIRSFTVPPGQIIMNLTFKRRVKFRHWAQVLSEYTEKPCDEMDL